MTDRHHAFDPVLILLWLNDCIKHLAPPEAIPDLEVQVTILRVMAGESRHRLTAPPTETGAPSLDR